MTMKIKSSIKPRLKKINDCLRKFRSDIESENQIKTENTDEENLDECHLECTKSTKKVVDYVEYVGPVHISLIDPPGYVYRKTLLETALLNLAYFFIGATVMMPLYYTLMFKHYWPMNLHILLGTLGSQIFMPAYFLTLNPLEGGSIFLKPNDKKKDACVLNVIAILCMWAVTGCLLYYREYYLTKFSGHSIAGFLGSAFCILNVLTFCCYVSDENSKLAKFVQFICTPAFLFSTISFISGMLKPSMVKWYPDKRMPMFLAAFCFIYTAIIIYRPVKNYLKLCC